MSIRDQVTCREWSTAEMKQWDRYNLNHHIVLDMTEFFSNFHVESRMDIQAFIRSF